MVSNALTALAERDAPAHGAEKPDAGADRTAVPQCRCQRGQHAPYPPGRRGHEQAAAGPVALPVQQRKILGLATRALPLDQDCPMIHNDVLRSLRYMLDISDAKLAEITRINGFDVSDADIASYLKKDEEEGFVRCPDEVIAHFLDGLVVFKRGRD
uniref:DUF1456 domain-containing protein n=1 Tax=Steinernema glaseri TaxID=37863 RepID=A0A1I7Y4P9_9BILA